MVIGPGLGGQRADPVIGEGDMARQHLRQLAVVVTGHGVQRLAFIRPRARAASACGSRSPAIIALIM